MGFSFARVVENTELNPRLRRIVFSVPDVAVLELPDLADEVVGIYFPTAGGGRPPAMENRDGVWGYYDQETPPEGRNYTVRSVDRTANTMVVDFVVHDHGVATLWAQGAQVGDEVGMSHARGWYRPEATTEWQLLVADLAGLPALARIITESDSSTALLAIVEVLDAADLDYLPTRPHVTVISSVGTGNGGSDGALADLVAGQTLPAGRGYCWFAGEAAQSRAVRKHLRAQGWPAEQFDIVGYWRLNSEAWDRRFEPVADELVAVYTAALAAGKGDKAASEEFDDALERAGL